MRKRVAVRVDPGTVDLLNLQFAPPYDRMDKLSRVNLSVRTRDGRTTNILAQQDILVALELTPGELIYVAQKDS
jgi:hypothetical protein